MLTPAQWSSTAQNKCFVVFKRDSSLSLNLQYHTITPRSSEHRRASDRDFNGRERSRSVSPQHHHRRYASQTFGESSSRHSSNHRQGSPLLQPRHTSSPPPPPPPPSHHHHYLPIAHASSSSSSAHPILSGRSRSRSPVSPPLSDNNDAAGSSRHTPEMRGRKQQSPVMTTVNTHNKIMNASYHSKLTRGASGSGGGAGAESGSKSANFISTQALAMQLPNGTLISPGMSLLWGQVRIYDIA